MTDLTDGETYDVAVTLYDTSSSVICTGEESVTHSASSTQKISPECSFSESDARNNAVFAFVYKLINDGGVSYEDIDKYFAVDFGIYDGLSRDQFMAEFIEDSYDHDFFEFDEAVELESVQVTELSVDTDGISEVLIQLSFSDGTVDTERVWMTEELGQWVLAGNGRLYEVNMQPVSVYQIDAEGNEEFKAGVMADLYDAEGNVANVSVSSESGVISGFLFEHISDCEDCDSLEISSPSQSFLISDLGYRVMGLINYTSSDPDVTDPMFTLENFYTDSSSDTFDYTVYGTLDKTEELSTDFFIELGSAESRNLYHYMNEEVTVNFTDPYWFDPVKIEVEVSVSDTYGNHDYIDMLVTVDKNYFVVDLGSELNFTPESGTLFITAYDSSGKTYMTVYELYYDESEAVPADSSALTMVSFDGKSTYDSDAVVMDTGYLVCGTSYDDSTEEMFATLVMYDESNGFAGYKIGTDSSDMISGCYSIEMIESGTSSYEGHTYVVGDTENYNTAVIFIDDDGTVLWSKTIASVDGATAHDAVIINDENLLVLMSGSYSMFILEFEPDGDLIGEYEIAMSGSYSGSSIYPVKSGIDNSGKLVIVGYFNNYGSAYPYVIATDTAFSTYGIYALELTDAYGDPAYMSSFEDVTFTADGTYLMSGFTGDYDGGDIVLAELYPDFDLFGYFIMDNYSTAEVPADNVSVELLDSNDSLLLTANISTTDSVWEYTQFIRMTSTSSGFDIDWQTSLQEDVSYFFVNDINTDSSGNIAFFGRTFDLVNDVIGLLFGGMNSDGTITDATLTDQLPDLGFRDYQTEVSPVSGAEITIGTASGSEFSVYLADAAAYLEPMSITEKNMLPFNQ